MVVLKKIMSKEEFKESVEALTSIFIEEYPYYSTRILNHMDEFISGKKQILSIKNNDELAGYIMIHFITNKIVKINGIYIFEEFKGQGVASNAILKLIDILKQSAIDLVYVQTRLDNNAVVHIFDKTNFKLIGTNFHKIEQKNNWVACNKINSLLSNEQEMASIIYDGFSPLNENDVISLREEHKNANLILKKIKKEGNK